MAGCRRCGGPGPLVGWSTPPSGTGSPRVSQSSVHRRLLPSLVAIDLVMMGCTVPGDPVPSDPVPEVPVPGGGSAPLVPVPSDAADQPTPPADPPPDDFPKP